MNIAYVNGERCSDLTMISLYNPSFLYGISCFEGIRAYWNAERGGFTYLDLEAHLDRLYRSAERMGLAIPVTREDIERQVIDILKDNQVQEDIYIRITVYLGGDGSWRTTDNVHYAISVRTSPSLLGEARSVTLGISQFRRIPSNSMPPQVKAGANYLNSRYAYLDVVARGFDDALFLTSDGYVSEATGSAVFFVEGDELVTASLDCDLLESITRQRLIDLCLRRGVTVRETHIKVDDLGGFDAAFLAGSSVEICAIASIEGHTYPVDHPVHDAMVGELRQWIADG